MIYGYIRISTMKQEQGNSKEDQAQAIRERYPAATLIEETYSGAKERPKFLKLLEKCVSGDTIVEQFQKLRAFFRLIEDSPVGRLIVTNLLAFAEFERAMIKERTDAGKAIARMKPDYKEGRHKKAVPLFGEYRRRVENGEMQVVEAIRELKITKSKWYRLCKEATV